MEDVAVVEGVVRGSRKTHIWWRRRGRSGEAVETVIDAWQPAPNCIIANSLKGGVVERLSEDSEVQRRHEFLARGF